MDTGRTPATGLQDSESDIKSALKKIIGASFRAHMIALCEGFLSSGQSMEICDVLAGVEELEKRMQKLASENWTPASSTMAVPESALSKALRTVIKTLEDLLLNIMEDADVKDLVRRELLLFQVAPDITLKDD